MLLSESLVWALESYDISGIKVFCNSSIRDDVAKSFLEDLTVGWQSALRAVEQERGSCEQTDIPARITNTDYGFFIIIGALDIRFCSGDYYDFTYGYTAFKTALENIINKYPEIECEGYIGYPLSDVRSGEAFQWEFPNGTDNVYDFVGEILGDVLAKEYYIPEEPREADDLNFVITGKLKHFENREEITEYIEDLGGNVTGSISKNTNYLINNDLNSASSKNTKAKALGIPIISETEFITTFGEPDEFDLESDFWVTFTDCLQASEDFEETLRVLYAYTKWISKADLDRTVRAIIDIARDCDEEAAEELIELVSTLASATE